MKIWIKNPLTIWTGNDLPAPTHGLLIEGSQIQLLLDEEPQSYDAIMDASGFSAKTPQTTFPRTQKTQKFQRFRHVF